MLKVDKVINHVREAGGVGHDCMLLCQVFNLSPRKSLSGKKPDLFVCQLRDSGGEYMNTCARTATKQSQDEHCTASESSQANTHTQACCWLVLL